MSAGQQAETMRRIWCEVLGLDDVGPHDSLFDLGGHSLTVTRLLARMRAELHADVPVDAFFDDPTIAGTLKLIEDCAPGLGDFALAVAAVPDRSVALSPAQERLWFLHELDPNDASYNMPVTVRIQGLLDVAALERALDELVERHEMLRVEFGESGGRTVQWIGGRRPALEHIDLAGHELQHARDLVAERANRPFALRAEPVVRLTLIRLTDDDHLLGIVLHHIAADGWSLEVLYGELSALYGAFTKGKPSPLAPMPMSFFDLVGQDSASEDAAVAYWTKALVGAPVLELPTDRPRRAVRSGNGERRIFELPSALAADLAALARTEHCTMFMVLLTAFQILLAEHSGQDDISVGIPVLGRDDVQTESLVGYLSRTLVVRGDLSGDPTFRDFLRATRGRTLRTVAAPDIPQERILAALKLERDRSRTPLFQAMFMMMHQERGGQPSLAGLDVEFFDQGHEQAKTDIVLDVYNNADGVFPVLTYDTDLFDRATADRIIRRYISLLSDIVARPAVRLSELSLLDADELAELHRWNETGGPLPRTTARELFAEQVLHCPHATALTFAGLDLSYAELDARADQIAALLGDSRRPGRLVAVCLHRTPDLIAALLAVWKIGAAYLPLDPDYPAERIAFIVADSAADTVLTERDLADRFDTDSLDSGSFDTGRVVCVEDARETSAPLPRMTTDPEDLAYVLYTSGSTGRPKGVEVPHRALGTFLHAMTDVLGAQQGAVWLASTSLSFDISALEVFLPLTTGARIVLAPEDTLRDGPALRRLIDDAAVTRVQATPSGWRLLLDADFTGRHIDALVGGEALPLQLARDLRSRVGRLVNMYGPTETTIWSSFWEVPEDPAEVVIGGPIAGTRLHVLDERLRQVPVGVVGELFITGDGVTRGYLRRPALTGERYLPDPYGPPGSRLYRTGDRVRRLRDGRVEFLGRGDNQVKLRGHRIELGEIEAVLETHPQVHAAAVAVEDDILAAYIVGRQEIVPDVLEHAAAALPSYMVPTAVVVLDELPLTPNGKLDRRVLSALRQPRPASSRKIVAPRTPAQQRVAAVFAEVLGAGPVGVDDDFFALGGHSLLAAKAIARLGEIPVRELFANPTVAGFAAALEKRGDASAAVASPLARRGQAPSLSPAQLRLWFLHRLDPESAAYNMYNVWRLRGPLDIAAFTAALGDLTERHHILRTRYPETDDGPIAIVEPVFAPTIEHCDMAGDEAAAASVVAERVNAPFDLTEAPPLRVSLFRLADDDHVCCIVTHHIAGDGWSLNILRDDLAALYVARRQDGNSAPPAPALQYTDIDPAYWHRDDTALDYWRARLADPTVLELPTDRPRPPQPGHRGGILPFRLSADLTEELEKIGRRHGATLFMVLLSAYQVLLARHSGQQDILVGSPAAGRDRVEFEQVIGYFTRTLVLRGDLSADPSFDELLARTVSTVLEALEHQDVPFEKLVTELGADRDPSRTPIFQTMAILHTQDEGTAADAFADLGLEFFEAGYRQAKFDLMLEGWRTPDGLLLVLDYDTDLFDTSTAATLAERFTVLLAGIAAEPSVRVGDLPMLTVEDRRSLAAWTHCAPAIGGRPGRTVPELIAAAVLRSPSAIAVSCDGEEIRYAELWERATRLAAAVRGHRRVGVCVGRSPAMIVALLAAWHAGAAYVPLDPAYPAERLESLIKDAGVTAVVAEPVHAGRLPSGVRIVDVAQRGNAHDPVAGPDAYVIHTSGSTGVPKGVLIGHADLAARVAWMVDEYELAPDDQVVQFASLSFDTHAEEIFPALAAGARIVLLPEGGSSLPDVLAAGPPVTVLDLPTAYWHYLVEQIDDIAWPATLRLVILGGEQAHGAAVARWKEKFGDRVQLVNTYGPTEATIIATAATLSGSPDASVRPPIGRPIAGTSAAVVDPMGRQVPPGAAGELALGGAGVARGYLGRPALTAERFVPDPDGAPGARRYLTGDVVRWGADGRLEFLGRRDDQVKVRGFRVEPGEVEACLTTHPGVGQAAVIAQDDRLTAFVVGAASASELTKHAADRLPAHLVPGAFVHLDRLPLTASGKVDRASLGSLAAGSAAPAADDDADDAAPFTEAEQLVAEIWSQVLGADGLRAGDDFFRIGGHSLLALRVTGRARAIVGTQVPVRLLFQHPTLAGFAAAVEDLILADLADLTEDEAERLLAEERP